MPKRSKTKPKQKIKPKHKVEPEPAITTKKSYWIILAVVLTLSSAVLGLMSGLDIKRTAILAVTILAPICALGYHKVTPSDLTLSKRATFLLIGISVIGFGIWAAIVLIGGVYGTTAMLVGALGSQFFVVTSLVICLSIGAFVGELIGNNKEVQLRLFNTLDEKE
jgi:ABC-type transport system involved in cytochrome c biogenesis permease component